MTTATEALIVPLAGNSRWVTITMLCQHAGGKDRSGVLRALKRAGVKVEKIPGCRGYRIAERDANRFVARQWPELGPMRLPTAGH